MKQFLAIIGLMILIACSKPESKLIGTWINSDFTSPIILTFTESQWIDNIFYGDTLNYFTENDSIFTQVYFEPKLIGFSYKISGDTLWTSFPGDLKSEDIPYIKSKKDHFFDDIKSNLEIDLNLPIENSNNVGNKFGLSIYLPKKSSVDDDYYIYLNNKRLKLDTLLHESIYDHLKLNEYIRFNLVGLYIDSEIKYQAVRLLKNELRKVQLLKIAYINRPRTIEYYAYNSGIIRKLPPIYDYENYYLTPDIKKYSICRIPPSPPNYYLSDYDENKSNYCKVEIIKDQIFLDNKKINLNDYYEKIRIHNPLKTYLSISDEANYQDYYYFISIQDSLLKRKRNALSRGFYQQEFDQLFETEKIKFINSKSKFHLIER